MIGRIIQMILMVLLIDERPEEVTEMIRSLRGDLLHLLMNRPCGIQVADMVIEKAKRLVEHKKMLSSCLIRLRGWRVLIIR